MNTAYTQPDRASLEAVVNECTKLRESDAVGAHYLEIRAPPLPEEFGFLRARPR
ncbi:MAG: hypothetical protein GTO22_02085 [Gemmatimonadales bacterium]|nr:hypothetical protein [Gemmatimonadales bacterium]